jgi:predicted Fe-Mo cluster-binding NifX family protein
MKRRCNFMKVCFSSNGNSSDSLLDPRFGRAAYFAVADTETMKFEIIENEGAATGGGAGITSGQFMVDKGVQVVVTGNVGPNAMNVLKAAEIEVYKGLPVSIQENLEKYKKGSLEKIDATVPQHFGMQGGQK